MKMPPLDWRRVCEIFSGLVTNVGKPSPPQAVSPPLVGWSCDRPLRSVVVGLRLALEYRSAINKDSVSWMLPFLGPPGSPGVHSLVCNPTSPQGSTTAVQGSSQ